MLGLPKTKQICVTCDGLEEQIEEAILYLQKSTSNALIDHFKEGGEGVVGEFSEERTARAIADLQQQGRVYEDPAKHTLKTKRRRVKPVKFRRSAKVR